MMRVPAFQSLWGRLRRCRLHACSRATATIGFLFMTGTMYVCIAAVFNTGVLIEQKMLAQTTADAAALTAASRMASAVNRMNMLNLVNLKAKGAAAMGGTCFYWLIEMISYLEGRAADDVADWKWLDPLNDYDAFLCEYDVFARMIPFGESIGWYSGFGDASDINSSLDIRSKQNAIQHGLVGDINAQLKALQEFVATQSEVKVGTNAFNVYVSYNDFSLYPEADTGKTMLFRESSYMEKVSNLEMRLYGCDNQWTGVSDPGSPPDPKDSWDFPAMSCGDSLFSGFKSEISPSVSSVAHGMWEQCMQMMMLYYVSTEDWGYELTSRTLTEEWTTSDRGMFQVVAVVEKPLSNWSFMAKGF